MMTAATAMSTPMSPFGALLSLATLWTRISRRNVAGLRRRLPFACLVLGAVVTFDWNPVALTPGTIGGRIALRADKDPPPVGGSCLAITAGIALRCGLRRRLPLGTIFVGGVGADRRI
jgi:hypothetical protein